jgi:hypothetical protein
MILLTKPGLTIQYFKHPNKAIFIAKMTNAPPIGFNNVGLFFIFGAFHKAFKVSFKFRNALTWKNNLRWAYGPFYNEPFKPFYWRNIWK